jgi:hypothetical protein
MTEALGMAVVGGSTRGGSDSSAVFARDFSPVKATEAGCMRSEDALVSGKDWQDIMNKSRQPLRSFIKYRISD